MKKADLFTKIFPYLSQYHKNRLFNTQNFHPMTVTYSVTAACQSRCKTCQIGNMFCQDPTRPDKDLKLDEIEKIFQTMKPVYFFNLSGGEPFMRNDLPEIVKLACKYLKPRVIHTPTNAILSNKIIQETERIIKIIREYDPTVPFTVKPSIDGIGEKHDEIRGVTLCKPYTPYQVTKYEGEQLLLDEFNKKNFPVIILRPSMIYGPGFKGDFLTLAKVCKTGFFPVIGKGKNLSPALFITDLIEVLPCCVDKGKIGEVYLISSEKSYPLHQVSEIIGRALNKKIVYVYVPRQLAVIGAFLIERGFTLIKHKPPITKRNIESTITDRIFVVKKAQKDLHFKQAVSLEKGLTETIQYFLEVKYL